MTELTRHTRRQETLDAPDCRFDLGILDIGPDGRLLTIRPEGRMTRRNQHVVMDFVARDPRFDLAMPTLWDLRDFDFESQSLAEIRGRVFAMARYPERRGVKRGYLVGTDTGYGIMRMFQETASGFGIEEQDRMMVSMHEGELLHWLTA